MQRTHRGMIESAIKKGWEGRRWNLVSYHRAEAKASSEARARNQRKPRGGEHGRTTARGGEPKSGKDIDLGKNNRKASNLPRTGSQRLRIGGIGKKNSEKNSGDLLSISRPREPQIQKKGRLQEIPLKREPCLA